MKYMELYENILKMTLDKSQRPMIFSTANLTNIAKFSDGGSPHDVNDGRRNDDLRKMLT